MQAEIYNKIVFLQGQIKALTELIAGVFPLAVTETLNQRPVVDSVGNFFVAIDKYNDAGVLTTVYINPAGGLDLPVGAISDVTDFLLSQILAATLTVNTGLTQPLTDIQLRATPVPVSFASASPTTLTLTSTLVPASTALTTILTGAKCVRIFVNGNFGTVNGIARTNNSVIDFKAGTGELLPAISYQTGLVTTLTIDVLR